MERVAIFIDGSNFYHGLKEYLGKTRINFYKFAALLCGEDRKLIRIYYYNAPYKKECNEEKYIVSCKTLSIIPPHFVL